MTTDFLHDPLRLNALHRLNILDTPAEPVFDDIVLAAAQMCGTRIALISLVDEDRQWFKARYGFDMPQTPICQSICSLGLCNLDPLVIPDLCNDPRTANNELVSRPGGIRFYAGAPLATRSGHIVGMLCVIDTKVRPGGLTERQVDGLKTLAGDVMRRVERRADERAQAGLAAQAGAAPFGSVAQRQRPHYKMEDGVQPPAGDATFQNDDSGT